MGNLCTGGISGAHTPTTDSDQAQTPVRARRQVTSSPVNLPLHGLERRPAAVTPQASPLALARRSPIGTPARVPTSVRLNSVQRAMIQEMLSTTVPAIDELVSHTTGIAALDAQHGAALLLRDQIHRCISGDMGNGGMDDFDRRLRRIRNQVNSYFALHPDAVPLPVNRPRGESAAVRMEVLQAASNILFGFESFALDRADQNEGELMRVQLLMRDIANNHQVHPLVIDAARDAGNDAAALVEKLLALVRRDPPVLSIHMVQ